MVKLSYSKKSKPQDNKETTEVHPLTEKEKKELQKTFAIGDTVVYPYHGIGKIERVEEHKIGDRDVSFFVIYIPTTKMSISIPFEQVKSKCIRHLISKEELESSLVHLHDKPENTNCDWKVRQQINNELVKNGDVLSTIKVIISLHSRNKDKDLPLQERRLYDSSVAMLVTEMALVYDITVKEANKRLKELLP